MSDPRLVSAGPQDDDLRFVRIRSKKHEIMIAPEFGPDREYYLVVVQDPSTE